MRQQQQHGGSGTGRQHAWRQESAMLSDVLMEMVTFRLESGEIDRGLSTASADCAKQNCDLEGANAGSFSTTRQLGTSRPTCRMRLENVVPFEHAIASSRVDAQPALLELVCMNSPGGYLAATVQSCFFDETFETTFKNLELLGHTIETFGFSRSGRCLDKHDCHQSDREPRCIDRSQLILSLSQSHFHLR